MGLPTSGLLYLTAFIMLEGRYFNFTIQHIWHGGQVHPFIIPKYAETSKVCLTRFLVPLTILHINDAPEKLQINLI